MIQAVTDQMRQRIGDALDQALYPAPLLTLVIFLVRPRLKPGRKIMDDTRESVKDKGNRHHTDRHDGFLQIPGVAFPAASLQRDSGAPIASVPHTAEASIG